MLITYIIDWGVGASGGQFALIQAERLTDAWCDADTIGSPKGIKELKIKQNYDDIRYMEFNPVDKPYMGEQVGKATNNKWYTSGEMFKKVYG
jgi:hypothetical protein